MICKKCGAEYPETAEKCPFCEAEEPAVVDEPVVEIPEITEDEVAGVEPVAEISKKTRKGLWIIVAAAVAILAVAATVFGISSNIYYTGANDDQASVYVITKKEMDRVYAKVGNKDAFLVKELGENEAFNKDNEFVVKNNNLYFLNDEGGLSIMNMKNGKSKEIGYDFKAGTLVLSAKGDTLLYVGEDGVLYKSTKGRQAKEIADIGETSFENTLPNYGFVEGTNDAWYAPYEAGAAGGTVYLETGENITENAYAVFYVGNEGKNVVYLTVTNEQIIEQEPVVDENGEETEVEPMVIRDYALMLKEEGKDPVVLSDKYEQTDSVSILHKENNGVLYLADKGEAPTDPETGEVIGAAAGTLYFHEFGGETIALDTAVTVALVLDELNGSNYWYDASDRAEDETIAYMKNDTISFMRDLKPIANPADFEFLTSTPLFADDNTFMVYKTYNPAPAKEETQEPAEGEEAAETEEPETAPAKLVFTKLVDGAWSDYTVVAENVIDYSYDEKVGKIYYLLNENDNVEKLVLYAYSVKNGETVKVADDVLGYMAFDEEGKNFYYVSAYNSETQTAALSHYNGKETKVITEGLSGCMIAEDGTPYVVVPDGDNTDLYVVDGTKTSLICKKMTNILYAR